MKIVYEGIISREYDDSGQGCSAEIDAGRVVESKGVPGRMDTSVVLKSWNRNEEHHVLSALSGKIVRITVETLDELPTGTVWRLTQGFQE